MLGSIENLNRFKAISILTNLGSFLQKGQGERAVGRVEGETGGVRL
jgi:hypothetical protein